jgi:5-methylcytosine-specific restriction endonuclease McrA
VKPLIAEGKVHLTGLALLDRVITPDNGVRLIQEAVGKTTMQIKAIIAREAPEVCASGVRKQKQSAASRWRFPDAKKQLSETTWRFQATMDVDTKALLDEVQDLENSNDCDQTLREALKAYRDVLKVKKQKALKRELAAGRAAAGEAATTPTGATKQDRTSAAASTRRPHDPHSSYIPHWMERAVRQRDGHQCTFVGYRGRCTARRDLQVHHIVSEALGGETEVWNLTLHCGEHNRFQAVLDLGPAHANSWRRRVREEDTTNDRG